MRQHLATELITSALDMAVQRQRPAPGLVHHSDRGCQYTSLAFGHRLEEAAITPSMGSVGDAYDKALAASFFATLECAWACRSRIPAFVQCSRTIRENAEGILAAIELGLSNSKLEGSTPRFSLSTIAATATAPRPPSSP